MQSFIDNLDETAMKVAADFAYKESLSQKTIPHSEILNVVKEELGWKWKSPGQHWQSSNWRMILEQISLQEGDRGVEESLNIYKNKYKRNRDTRNSLIFA